MRKVKGRPAAFYFGKKLVNPRIDFVQIRAYNVFKGDTLCQR